MIKITKSLLYAVMIYISIAGLVTFSQFICEEAFQTVMFGTWPAKNAKQWELVKTGTELMEHINNRSKNINKYFGWIQPIAWFAYDSYCNAADFYVAGLRSEVFANKPELFIGEKVRFTFVPNKISYTDNPINPEFIASNGRMAVITVQDIKIQPMQVAGVLEKYKNLYVVRIDKLNHTSILNLSKSESDKKKKSKKIYTAAACGIEEKP